MLSEFFKIPIRIQEAASFFIYQILTWAVWNLFEELLMWFHRFEFSALINLVLSRPVSSQGYTYVAVYTLSCLFSTCVSALIKKIQSRHVKTTQTEKRISLYQSLQVINIKDQNVCVKSSLVCVWGVFKNWPGIPRFCQQ